MPSKPKIPREVILKAALGLLIESGYESVNIKNLAEKLNCSTQPISWHFGSMEGLRKALTEFAVAYADGKMRPQSESAFEAFMEVGAAYVDIAFDEPQLFKYLYLSGESKYSIGGLDALSAAVENKELIDGIAEELKISWEQASAFLVNSIIYSTGILALAVSGVMKCDKAEVRRMINSAGQSFLSQAGANMDEVKLLDNVLSDAKP